ncbi:MAG: T9SS type A sorting domain-containing protein [Candidatus Cloacimonetes bacterium]|nr:T9SS type A sorting domain-containing protein [Candidatus Cloacimonadota bacterium]
MILKFMTILLLLFSLLYLNLSAQEPLGGYYEDDITIDPGYYIMVDSLVIGLDAVCTIMPGVHIDCWYYQPPGPGCWLTSYSIIVYGGLMCVGTEDDSIYIYDSFWGLEQGVGIIFKDGFNRICTRIEYTDITDIHNGVHFPMNYTSQDTIIIRNNYIHHLWSGPAICHSQNCIIENNTLFWAGSIEGSGCNFYYNVISYVNNLSGISAIDSDIKYNTIHHCGCGIGSIDSELMYNTVHNCNIGIYFLYFDPLTTIVKYNNIYDNIYNNAKNNSQTMAILEYNWWGSDPPDTTLFSGPIDYDPWLTEPWTPDTTSISEKEFISSNNLINVYPNPFNPETKIIFSIPKESKVNLSIYNIKGQKVRTLLNNKLEKGFHEFIWNSKDNNGKSVASGVYLYKFDVNGKTKGIKKMLLLK